MKICSDICPWTLSVLKAYLEWKTVHLISEQIMSADKYPSLFLTQMEAIVYTSVSHKKCQQRVRGCPWVSPLNFYNSLQPPLHPTFPNLPYPRIDHSKFYPGLLKNGLGSRLSKLGTRITLGNSLEAVIIVLFFCLRAMTPIIAHDQSY